MKKHGFAITMALVVAFFVAVVGLTNVAQSNATTEVASTVEAKTAWSNQLNAHWNYRVYLPKGYDQPENADTKYPVVYMMHGWGGNVTNMTDTARIDSKKILDDLIDSGKVKPMIVVFIDGFNSYYVDGPEFKMESAITEDLVPMIDANYRTIASRDGRAVAGISMGGYGAQNLALNHQDMFCCAGMMSPALWDGDLPEIAAIGGSPLEAVYREHSYENNLEKATSTDTSFFVYQGEGDQVVDVNAVDNFVKTATDKGFDVQYSTMEKGPHAWATWKTMYPTILQEISDRLS